MRDRLAALSLFPRTSLKRCWFNEVMQLAVRLGLDRFMTHMTDSPDALLPADACRELLERIKQCYGGDPLEWLITWPAMATRKRLYILYRVRARGLVGVVKIGAGVSNARQFENEAAMLTHLAGVAHPFAVPSVRMQESWPADRTVLVLDGFPAVGHACSGQEAKAAANMICEHLQSLDVPKRRVMLGDEQWGRSAAGLPEAFDAGFAHGDLGPGNMTMTPDGRVLLYDWENASCEAPKETDRIGFWLALHQRSVLCEPQETFANLLRVYADVPEENIRLALAFLAAHDNLAARKLLGGEMGKMLKQNAEILKR